MTNDTTIKEELKKDEEVLSSESDEVLSPIETNKILSPELIEGENDSTETSSDAKPKKKPARVNRYFEAVGRRKTAIGRVRLFTKMEGAKINDKSIEEYFPSLRLQKEAFSPIEKMKLGDKLGAVVKVQGGGLTAQAEAIKLGIARALIVFNPIFRKRLRKLGLLTRDARIVERKHYGLRKARRAPQWRKR